MARQQKSKLYSNCSVPSGVRDLKELIRYTKEDPRESSLLYDTCTRFESALARPGLGSPEYAEAKQLLDRSKSLICAELKEHGAHALVIMSLSANMWSHAGWPEVTVPLGYFGNDEPLIPCQIVTKTGETVDCPFEVWKSHPNR